MEQRLIDAAIGGDKEAFGELMHLLKVEAYKVAYMITKNEDLSIEAYLSAVEKAFIKLNQLKERKYFKTWFLRIVINESKNLIRLYKNVKNEVDFGDKTSVEFDICGKVDLERALKKVDSKVQEMIRLKYYMGYTLEEIAEILNMPVGTIKGRMYTTLKALRKELEVTKNEA